MSDTPSLVKLSDLATQFTKAAAGKLRSDGLAEQVRLFVAPEEQAEILDIAGRLIVAAAVSQASNLDPDTVKEKIAPETIRLCEITAGVFSRLESDEDLSSVIPDAERTAEISDGFRQQNAATLARLFAPKAP